MKTQICITTAPRKVVRLGKTLESLAAINKQNWPVAVFVEPEAAIPEDTGPASLEITWYMNGTRRGCLHNWLLAANETIQVLCTTADRVLFLQDDIVFAPSAFEELVKAWPRFQGVCSLYTNRPMAPVKVEQGWGPAHYSEAMGYWGALALCVDVYHLRSILRTEALLHPEKAHPPGMLPEDFRKVDVLFGRACLELGIPIYTPIHSLVDHTGTESTIGRDKIKGIQENRRGYRFGEPLPT